jgi:hypothetical protein
MEFGEAVLFAKFLREHVKGSKSYLNLKHSTAERFQKEEPGLWFKWLAWKAARQHKLTDV